MINFDRATVVYPGDVRALEDLSLTVNGGEFVVIVGLSGAGKSTLIRTVNGLVPVTSGFVEVENRRIDQLGRAGTRQLRAEVGMVFQAFNLVKRTSVLNNVLMGRLHDVPLWRSLLGAYRDKDVKIAMQSLELVEILEKAYVRASNLSGGQQQRVGIARALAQQPKVILADEPVASLDPPTSHVVMKYLQDINRRLGITMLVNLHFLDLAKKYADRVIGLREGQLVFDGPGSQATEETFEQIYGRSLTADDVLDGQASL